MKIAIISDIHENFHNLVLCIESMKKNNVEQIICLGDLMNGGIAKMLAGLDIPTVMVWGNNDGDKVAITKIAHEDGSNITVGFETFDIVEFEGRKIFLTHYPMLAKPMAKSQEFDAVFYGHNHIFHKEFIGNCLVLNPGEISAHKTNTSSYSVYDTQTNDAQIIELEESVSVKTELVTNYRAKNNQEYQPEKHHKL